MRYKSYLSEIKKKKKKKMMAPKLAIEWILIKRPCLYGFVVKKKKVYSFMKEVTF